MNTEMILIVDIDADDRLREIDREYAEFISTSMEDYGLRQPIEVRKVGKRYKLITGGHRLVAAKLLDWVDIPAVVLKANDLEARLLEIDENLFRRELSPLDHSTFLAKRKEVYEALHPETKHGGDRKSDQSDKLGDLIASFSEETAERMGISSRSIERAVARYKNILPDVRQQIAGTWVANSGSQLDELAKQTPEMQRQVVDFVQKWPRLRKVSEIVRQIEQRPKPKAPGTYEKFIALWRKATADERKQILTYLSPELPGFQTEREAA
ncbi:ParB N-terminal domain-containing protein [Gluconacetobacter entanii]|uniref:ParB N-terminal domain-containing protein n=1 Tax=Gluconacetobacter entanii TaxID=108528 RepID=A0ABT3K1W0_9PROT|nr:ParB N-terminal domain-containing protein [Gluconacetobacter entanii]MCW4589396.1 ParB N-terminal domain-containing protein [Gluconacetobacter entanii]MCW4592514.1 ParB N-terminal domain-containing protein [Gluconacetobacter entanii]NPC87631.1 ParB N-terminal domain-containing protein [Gluconacetobacter entanii]